MIIKNKQFSLISDFLNKIESNGFEAYVIGGYVRNKILGISSNDIDITTNARPKDIINIFGKVFCSNDRYGSVIVNYKNSRFEVTTYRKEIKYDSKRRPVEIKYIDSLSEDLKRRDFTVNSICMNKNGKIIDLLDGRKDIKMKVIKSIGDSNNKLCEDPLRILRAIRFASVLNFRLSDDLREAILINKHLLRNLSYDRRREELDKIFMSKNAKYGCSLLISLGIDKELELNLTNINHFDNILGVWSLIDNSDYIFTKNERDLISNIKACMRFNEINNFTLYKYGLYVNQIVGEFRGISKKVIAKLYNKLPIKDINDIAINGNEIIDILNIEGGAILKEIYMDMENAILRRKLKNKNAILKKYIVDKYKK